MQLFCWDNGKLHGLRTLIKAFFKNIPNVSVNCNDEPNKLCDNWGFFLLPLSANIYFGLKYDFGPKD